jgi:hypothetical protein
LGGVERIDPREQLVQWAQQSPRLMNDLILPALSDVYKYDIAG